MKPVATLSIATGLVAALAAGPRAPLAQVWTEVGDAGDLPATAQIPVGSGPLTTIRGNLSPGGDADLYLIQVDDPSSFEATTCEGTFIDTQLWLFDLNGEGITFDDDDPDCGVLSTITGTFGPGSGRHYLACSAYDWDALDQLGAEIWLDEPFDRERAPDGPGAPGPLSSWGDLGYEEGSYEITLVGVSWPVIGIEDLASPAPAEYTLHANVPNPCRPTTTIRYDLPQRSRVSLRIYEPQGRLVRVLEDRLYRQPGRHQVRWDGRNESGQEVASGVYLYRIEAGRFGQTRRLTLLR